MTACTRQPRGWTCTARATGRVAHSWEKHYFPNGKVLFMTEPLCDVHQADLCRDMQAEGIRAFAVPLDYEQRMEQARAASVQCRWWEE